MFSRLRRTYRNLHFTCTTLTCRLLDIFPQRHYDLVSRLKTRVLRTSGIRIELPGFADQGFRCINPQLISIGRCASFGHDNHIWAFTPVRIGHHVMTAKDVRIISASHDVSSFEPILDQEVTIGPGCWIGARVTILGGVTIGTGCVIGAGSLVRTSLPDWSVAVGVPAKVVRRREPAARIWHQYGWYDRSELEPTLPVV